MKDCMRYARVEKVVIQYYLDGLPSQKKVLSFRSLDAYHQWLYAKAQENKVVTQMLLRYEYPEA